MQSGNSLYITLGFITLIVVGFLFFAIRPAKSLNQGPSILTMLGILGTFLGIALGLNRFDPHDIQASLPALLDGLRTAFWASFAGVLFSILLKVWNVYRSERPTKTIDPTSLADPVDRLTAHLAVISRALVGDDDSTLLTQLKLMRTESRDGLTKIHVAQEALPGPVQELSVKLTAISRALVGDDESTLLTQLKLMRGESRDGFREMQRSQEAFFEKISELSSKALIEALGAVIRDFNDKITEQFGDNFKQLNLAVGSLVTWQEQYRQQLEQLIAIESASFSALDDAASRYTQLLDHGATFKDLSDGLGASLTLLVKISGDMDVQTASLQTAVARMEIDVPRARTEIVGALDAIVQGSKYSREQIEAAAATLHQQVTSSTAHLVAEIERSVDASTASVTTSLTAFAAESGTHVAHAMGTVSDTTTRMGQALEHHAATITQTIAAANSAAVAIVENSATILNEAVSGASSRSALVVEQCAKDLQETVSTQTTAVASTISAGTNAISAETRESVATVAKALATFASDASGQVDTLTAAMHDMTNRLSQSVEGSAKAVNETLIKANASTLANVEASIANLNASLVEATTGTSKFIEKSAVALNEAVTAQSKAASETVKAATAALAVETTRSTDAITEALTAEQDAVTAATAQITTSFREAADHVSKDLTQSLSQVNAQINDQVRKLIADSKEQIAALDAALEQELTTSLKTLGQQLTALSERFVKDYTPLTEQLHALIAEAKR